MKKQKGQTLIEILFAFSISILVLSAVIGGVTTTLSNTQYTKNQNLANSYAQEGMAVVRGIRDSSWTKFSSYTTNTTYCISQNSTTLTDPIPPALNCGQNVGIFSREVKFEHASQSCIADPSCLGPACLKGSKVTVKVSWSDSKCPVGTPLCHKVELITCFGDINSLPTPLPVSTPTPGPTSTPGPTATPTPISTPTPAPTSPPLPPPPPPGTFNVVGGVWNDANGNGAKDGAEVNMPGVIIKIIGGAPCTSTVNLSTTTTSSTPRNYEFLSVPVPPACAPSPTATYLMELTVPLGFQTSGWFGDTCLMPVNATGTPSCWYSANGSIGQTYGFWFGLKPL